VYPTIPEVLRRSGQQKTGMDSRSRTLFVLVLSAALGLTLISGGPEDATRWYKGSTHAHSLWSDGDAAPEHLADWYRSRGYHFLVISDHNILQEGEKWKEVTPAHLADLTKRFGGAVDVRERNGTKEMRLRTLSELRTQFEEPERFLFLQGQEINDVVLRRVSGQFVHTSVHHNTMNHTHLIAPPGGTSVRELLERTIAAVEAEAAKSGRKVLVHLNHPNYEWGVTAEDLAHVLGERFFEVYNGHRGVRNYGDKEHLSCEQIWDHVLTLRLGKLGGPPLYAFATDDAHNYHGEQLRTNPGRGWIMVRAESLKPDALIDAMERGDFYASSGVVLEDVQATRTSLSVKIAAVPGVTYVTRFIGSSGLVLKEIAGTSASYAFTGTELYVRAVVVSDQRHPNGYEKTDLQTAWSQPVVVRRN
jgi:hypothetical protein